MEKEKAMEKAKEKPGDKAGRERPLRPRWEGNHE